jgi:hypothetical protein
MSIIERLVRSHDSIDAPSASILLAINGFTAIQVRERFQ